MVYSETDLLNLGADADDSHVADKAEDMKPRFHRAKSHTFNMTEEQKAQLKQQQKAAGQAVDDDDDDSDFDDEDEDDDDDYSTEWTLRKCSAAALDVLANVFQNDILDHLLPLLKQLLSSQDWKQRECGILALGAIAEGCMDGVEPHLKDLVKFMSHSLTDTKVGIFVTLNFKTQPSKFRV
jgi:transportin-1